MLDHNVFLLVFAATFALLGAGIFLTVAFRYFEQPRQTARAMVREAEEDIVFLFDGNDLIDATKMARSLLRARVGDMSDWDRFIAFFAPNFPQLRRRLATLSNSCSVEIASHDNPETRIVAECWQGLKRVSYVEQSIDARSSIERAKKVSTEDELVTLRGLAEDAPLLMWKEDETQTITWVNKAYLAATAKIDADRLDKWPPSRLFQDAPVSTDGTACTARLSIDHDGIGKHFDVTTLAKGSEILHFAVDVTSVATAEETQRSYVGTLVKTFAHLSIGLAVFDLNRQLIVFNPALFDMTGLPIDFLSNRPDIHDFLNRLRENRMTPEPKNFGGWREQIAALETAASSGTYSERWDLPSGQTFRVTGRPHPNGAIALIFEDISDETSATRRFRHMIDTGQAALDQIDDAVAVFSQAGTLIMSNRAYAALWHSTNPGTLIGSSYQEESRIWQQAANPSPIWIKVQNQILDPENKSDWKSEIRLADGRGIWCHISPLPNHATMVRFLPLLEPVFGSVVRRKRTQVAS